MIRINKKNNPYDKDFIKQIKIDKRIEKSLQRNNFNIVYDIYFNKNEDRIGYAIIQKGNDFITDVEIDEEYRRKGLATYVYNYIEKDLKIKLRPSFNQLEDGFLFWKTRNK